MIKNPLPKITREVYEGNRENAYRLVDLLSDFSIIRDDIEITGNPNWDLSFPTITGGRMLVRYEKGMKKVNLNFNYVADPTQKNLIDFIHEEIKKCGFDPITD